MRRLRTAAAQALLLTAAACCLPAPQVLDNNCCHFINQVLLGAGSSGVEEYFPDYWLPSWEPRD